MRIAGTVRVISAVAVLLCAFLPITKCNQFLSETTTYEYSWSRFSAREVDSWILLLVFFWPVALVLLRRSMRRSRAMLMLRILEPCLAAGSAYLLYVQTLFASGFAIGGLVAFWSLVCFGLASLFESAVEAVRLRGPRWKRA